MKNWNMLRTLAACIMLWMGQFLAFADTDTTAAVTYTVAENVAAECTDSIAETMGVQTDRGNRLNTETLDTEALDTETTAEAGNTEPASLQQVTPLAAPFNYKKTPEWRRFVLFTGLGVASAAITVTGVLYTTLCIMARPGVTLFEGLMMGGTGLFLAGTVTSFIFAHKNLNAAIDKRDKAGQQMTAGFGVGTLAAPMSGNRTELMPALSLSLSF